MFEWFGKQLWKMNERRAHGAAEGEAGFTLIELLVVVIIIGILAAIAIPVFLAQREKAWQASQESDMRNMAATATACSADGNGSFAACDSTTALNSYGFHTSPDVTCNVTTASTTDWAGNCHNANLPDTQTASFSTTGANAGSVTRNGY